MPITYFSLGMEFPNSYQFVVVISGDTNYLIVYVLWFKYIVTVCHYVHKWKGKTIFQIKFYECAECLDSISALKYINNDG